MNSTDFIANTFWIAGTLTAYLVYRGMALREASRHVGKGLVHTGMIALAVGVLLAPFSDVSFLTAFFWSAAWIVLAVVPITVFKRVPSSLLPRATLSEIVFWNMTVVSISFAQHLGGKTSSLPTFFHAMFALFSLWPAVVAIGLKQTENKLVSLLRYPLTFYFWFSLCWWTIGPLLDKKQSDNALFGFIDGIYRGFAGIQIFAILYTLYYVLIRDDSLDGLDDQTPERVEDAISNALEIDFVDSKVMLLGAVILGLLAGAITYMSTSREWNLPIYWILTLPFLFAELLREKPERLDIK